MMKKLEYKVTLTTPAFLGNAGQTGQWRTPPFKALLRHWWRVAVAKKHDYNCGEIREVEGQLFGNAWLDSGPTRSLVRMRLDRWSEGSSDWQTLEKIGAGKNRVAADLYLGYGPVKYDRNTKLSRLQNAALQAGHFATLSLAVPEEYEEDINNALALIHRFGTVGGRSRNGWGSVSLEPEPKDGPPEFELGAFTSPLEDALKWDWPHAIGVDTNGRPLIWETAPATDWKGAMKTLGKLRKELNSKFKSHRRWLNYPVTGLSVREFPEHGRLPNSLRFKVVMTPAGNGNNRIAGLVFHTPCLPPPDFKPDGELIEVWKKVHQFLDGQTDGQTKLNRKPS